METQFGIGPRKLLQGMLGEDVKADLIIKALQQYDQYKLKTIPKKSGGLRSLYVPPSDLKQLQKLILTRFLYRFKNKLSLSCHGFLPKKSILTNANSHRDKQWRHVIHLDLKDAFPSVKSEMIKAILQEYLLPEINDYEQQYQERKKYPNKWFKKIYHKHPIFPTRRVRWFRRLIINHPGSDLPLDIAERFIDHLISLTTFQGRLPQGAPTSPFLLNLVISYLGIPESISNELDNLGYTHVFTIYADDMVISTKKEIPPEVEEKLITIIEASGVFTVNRKKTIRFNRCQIAPLITGLRIVKQFNSHGGRLADKIAVPKKKILAIRSLIYKATTDPSEKKDKKVAGYIAFLKGIYSEPGYYSRSALDSLPPAILKPYRKYLEYLDSVKCQNLNI
jgi:hypothetical protein